MSSMKREPTAEEREKIDSATLPLVAQMFLPSNFLRVYDGPE